MNKFRVLIVEDVEIWESVLNEIVQNVCQKMNVQYEIQVARDVDEARILLAKGDTWNMLCTDIGLSSIGTGKKEGMILADWSSTKKIPTIIVSGTASLKPDDVRVLLKEYGAIDYFDKNSFRKKDFCDCVTKIIQDFIKNVQSGTSDTLPSSLKTGKTNFSTENKLELYLIFGFSIAFIIAILVLTVAFPNPTLFQYTVFRIVLALFSAGIAAMIPGVIDLNISFTAQNYIRAGGAIAVFVILYFYSPATLVLNPK